MFVAHFLCLATQIKHYIYNMKAVDLIHRLERIKFTKELAEGLAEILMEQKETQVTREYVALVVSRAKFELLKWIVGAVVVNGIIATALKYLGKTTYHCSSFQKSNYLAQCRLGVIAWPLRIK